MYYAAAGANLQSSEKTKAKNNLIRGTGIGTWLEGESTAGRCARLIATSNAPIAAASQRNPLVVRLVGLTATDAGSDTTDG